MPTSRLGNGSKLVPYWQSECERAVVYVGDCRDVMAQMELEQFHAIVTDPPYELSFMGRSWDSTGVAYDIKTWKELLGKENGPIWDESTDGEYVPTEQMGGYGCLHSPDWITADIAQGNKGVYNKAAAVRNANFRKRYDL